MSYSIYIIIIKFKDTDILLTTNNTVAEANLQIINKNNLSSNQNLTLTLHNGLLHIERL